MSTNISADDLNQILARWDRYNIPKVVKEKTTELMMKVVDKIGEMIFLGHFDINTTHSLLNTIGEKVTRPFILCYYIGYDLASGKISRLDGTAYLMAATDPIEGFIFKITEFIALNGATSEEKWKEMAGERSKLEKLSVDTAKLIGEVSNDICILGIENFKKIGYR